MKFFKLFFFAVLVILTGTASAGGFRPASDAEKRLIVDTAFVADAIKRGAVLWDVRATEDYRKGHLPGAVNIGAAGAALRFEHNEDFRPTPQIEKLLGDAGIDPAREIIVYGGKADASAYFGLFAVQYFGGEKAHVYHGGIDDWKAAKKEISHDPAKPLPVALKLVPRPELSITTAEVVSKLTGNVQIVDTRTPREFSGEDIRALRGGHIPGAVNIPFQKNWADPDTLSKLARKEVASKDGLALKSPDQLHALYGALDPDKETIVYCQSGVRAAQSAAVLKDLGFRNVKIYDASWLGYANAWNTPVDNATVFNVGQMNGKLDAMQRRLEAMERLLGEMLKAMK
jgi:thiosulfate/3-mercaptopyruvate sulfurtransferase